MMMLEYHGRSESQTLIQKRLRHSFEALDLIMTAAKKREFLESKQSALPSVMKQSVPFDGIYFRGTETASTPLHVTICVESKLDQLYIPKM